MLKKTPFRFRMIGFRLLLLPLMAPIILTGPIVHAHVVKTHDGEELRCESATYGHDELLLDGKTAIPRERVKEIFFEMPEIAPEHDARRNAVGFQHPASSFQQDKGPGLSVIDSANAVTCPLSRGN